MFISALLVVLAVAWGRVEANNDCKLYGSRTSYEEARNYLSQTNRYPSSFGPRSLEEEHKDLTENSCKPVVFYFFGRHAARFSSSEDIDRDNRILLELKERLRQQHQEEPREILIQSILDWEPTMDPRMDKLVTEFGVNEERKIALRFKELYPEFFDATKTDILFGNTNKLRTAQTLAVFLNEVDNFELETRLNRKLSTNDRHPTDYSIDEITNNPLYNDLLANHYKDFLDFHRICNKIHGKVKIKEPLVELVKKSSVLEGTIRQINTKLGFENAPADTDNPINSTVITSIYDACRYEFASGDRSIWCSLLDEQSLEILNYIEDIESYVKTAYGPNSRSEQSCTVIRDLVGSLKKVQRPATESSSLSSSSSASSSSQNRRSSHFYFAHETNLGKLFALLGLFKDGSNYSKRAISEFTRTLRPNQSRQWQVAFTEPFSTNIAFVLYECESANKPTARPHYKLLTAVNERPVRLAGCKDIQCSIGDFDRRYQKLSSTCDLNRICARKNKSAGWLQPVLSTGTKIKAAFKAARTNW